MKNFFYGSISLMIALFLLPPATATAADLSVVFEATPLFLDADVKPGDGVSRTVVVTNNSANTEAVYVDVENTFSNGLDDAMTLLITTGGTTYYSGTFNNFFATTPVALGDVGSGASRTYVFTAAIDTSTGNAYQQLTFGFDLVIGFENGESSSDGGGGSGGGGSSLFGLFNETVVSAGVDDGVVLSWNTSREATTYLVCGNVNDGPFVLDPKEPFFGYSFDVEEIDNATEIHKVTLSDLTLGTYECRPASRPDTGDDFTVGNILEFTLSPTGQVAGESVSIDGLRTGRIGTSGSVLGIDNTALVVDNKETVLGTSTSDSGDIIESDTATVTQNIIPVVIDKLPCTIWWLVLLVTISFVWSLVEDRLRKSREQFGGLFIRNLVFTGVYISSLIFLYIFGLLETYWWLLAGAWAMMTISDYRAHWTHSLTWIPQLRNAFFTITSILVVISSLLFSFPCVWWPFLTVTITSLILLFFDKK